MAYQSTLELYLAALAGEVDYADLPEPSSRVEALLLGIIQNGGTGGGGGGGDTSNLEKKKYTLNTSITDGNNNPIFSVSDAATLYSKFYTNNLLCVIKHQATGKQLVVTYIEKQGSSYIIFAGNLVYTVMNNVVTAVDIGGMQFKKLDCKNDSDNHLAIYDGTKKLTMTEVKELYNDPKWFIYLEYLNIVMIPEARYLETSNAFEFGGQFQEGDKPYIARVIINNENVVKYDQKTLESSDNKIYEEDEYDEEDEEQYFNAKTLVGMIGKKSDLLTLEKDTLVEAINYIYTHPLGSYTSDTLPDPNDSSSPDVCSINGLMYFKTNKEEANNG